MHGDNRNGQTVAMWPLSAGGNLMKPIAWMLSLGTAVACLSALYATVDQAAAQRPVRTTPITPRAIALAPATPGAPKLTVTSPDFENGGILANKFMQPTVPGGENKSPGVGWSRGPEGTQSYVLFAEGEGETRPDPTVHWIVYNIP